MHGSQEYKSGEQYETEVGGTVQLGREGAAR